jgi:hypothetical protein
MMLWIILAVAACAGILALTVAALSKRAAADDLGSVSSNWVAAHRADWR